MKTVELTTASEALSDYVKIFGGENVLLTSHQKPIAVVIPLENTDRESLTLGMNPEFADIIENARKEFRDGRKLSFEEMKREVLPI